MFAEKRKTLAHPFHVKSTWQPPIQNSVALERYLEETKLELASTVFHAPLDNISASESKAIGSLKRNSKINQGWCVWFSQQEDTKYDDLHIQMSPFW